MWRSERLILFLAIAAALGFVYLLVQMLLLRYERGDVFAPYSTLRADPLGARVLYEALDSTDQYRPSRGFSVLHRALATAPGSLLYLGMGDDDLGDFSHDEVDALDRYVRGGGRVVICFSPEGPAAAKSKEEKDDAKAPDQAPDQAPVPPSSGRTRQERYERDEIRKEAAAARDKDKESKKTDQGDEDSLADYHPSLAALWGFGWEQQREPGEKKSDSSATAKAGAAPDDSPTASSSDNDDDRPEVYAWRSGPIDTESGIPWKSALAFVRLEPDWQVLYQVRGQPVLIHRTIGRGEVILASDSYFISNEAMRQDRSPRLLAFLIGPPGTLLFDETHLGTQDQEGVVRLAEKFHLQGFFFGGLIVLALAVWRNSVPLVPPDHAEAAGPMGGVVSGKDSRTGLINLLHRNIPSAELLAVCLATWKRARTPNQRSASGPVAEMEGVVARATPEQVVTAYHELRVLNSPRKGKAPHAAAQS